MKNIKRKTTYTVFEAEFRPFQPMTNDDDDNQDGSSRPYVPLSSSLSLVSYTFPSILVLTQAQISQPLPSHKGYHDDKDTPFRQRRHARLKEAPVRSRHPSIHLDSFSRLVCRHAIDYRGK